MLRKALFSLLHSRLIGDATASAAGRLWRRRVFLSIDEDELQLGAGLEQISARDQQIGDFALLQTAEAIGDAINLGGRKRHGANRVLARESCVDGLLYCALNIARLFEAI